MTVRDADRLERRFPLAGAWSLAEVDPGAASTPEELGEIGVEWSEISGPGTVAGRSTTREGPGVEEQHLDRREFWFRCAFEIDPVEAGVVRTIDFHGLATLVDVWLNGEHLFASTNMFRACSIAVDGRLERANTLLIRCRALEDEPLPRVRRPRWKSLLVADQRIRQLRTTFLGRIPGWSASDPAVGPWRPIEMRESKGLALVDRQVRTSFDPTSRSGRVHAHLRFRGPSASDLESAILEVGDDEHRLEVTAESSECVVASGSLVVESVAPWWPTGMGEPRRHPCRLRLTFDGGDATDTRIVPLDALGFRSIEVDEGEDGCGFSFRVNGVPVFCRGACWTPLDPVGFESSRSEYESALRTLRSSGLNMVRVAGPTVYETDEFYDVCDELGILVWQDLMFASVCYPDDDPGFVEDVEHEARAFLERCSSRSSIALLCGGSEVAQQAAFMGVAREAWLGPLFTEALPLICAGVRPDVPYLPSTPWGGDLPFRVGTGVTHDYRAGAYRRALGEARSSPPRFAAECLGFAQYPDDGSLRATGLDVVTIGSQRAGVPRDSGSSWDFADITDHYLEALSGHDPARLRATSPDLYSRLVRLVPGLVMVDVLGAWRGSRSRCGGALVWFSKDLVPGAGWGLLDSRGYSKPALRMLRGVLAPRTIWFVDRGHDGLDLMVANDASEPLAGALDVRVLSTSGACIADGTARVDVEARGLIALGVEDLVGRFVDVTYVYRFGDPQVGAVVGRFVSESGDEWSTHFLARPLDTDVDGELRLESHVRGTADDGAVLVVTANRLARFVTVDLDDGFVLSGPFHLAPGEERGVPIPPGSMGRVATVRALNASDARQVTLGAEPDADRPARSS